MDDELQGRVIDGKYRLTRPLGQGGMGVVWVATHTALGREFAVKLLRPEFAGDAQTLIRFQQEAVAVSKVGNPHLVALTDFGTTADGAPYIVMELLEGCTLEEAMRAERPMAVPRIVDIVCQMLTGLAAVHERGIVHRDLKPANVFLTQLGERQDFVKLLDFGVAKVLGGDRVSHFTRTGVLLGTPTYMSPEQAQGGRGVDHRADLWAVGVILFRALTGRRPHDATSRGERLAAIATQDVPPLRRFRPDLDEELEAILRRALTREVGRRFATALDFRAALEPFRGQVRSAYATSLAPPPVAARELRLGAVLSAPPVGSRPAMPAAGLAVPGASTPPAAAERPTVGPAAGEPTRCEGVADEPREFSFGPSPAEQPPSPASFPPAAASSRYEVESVRPSQTATGEPSLTTAAGLRRRPGTFVAAGLVAVVVVGVLLAWLLTGPADDGRSNPTPPPAAGPASDVPSLGVSSTEGGPDAEARPDAVAALPPIDPGLRARYVRAQTQITCWQYFRMYHHPRSPTWDARLDIPEACLLERMSLRDWRRVVESLTRDELLEAASEATRAAVPCIMEASGLSATQVEGAVPTIAGHQAEALGDSTPRRPPRDGTGPRDAAVGVEPEHRTAEGGSGAATPRLPPPPAPQPPPLLDAAAATTDDDDAGTTVADDDDAGTSDTATTTVAADAGGDAGPPVPRSAEAGVAPTPIRVDGPPGEPDGGTTKDVHIPSVRELRPVRPDGGGS